MRIWFDTEFIEDGKTIDLISIGLVREDGAELYLESSEYDASKASQWVRENVFPHLETHPDHPAHDRRCSRREMAQSIVSFAGERPEFWAYFADYDWVVLCQLFGTMMNKPASWPFYCRDLKQYADFFSVRLPAQEGVEHHALADAKWAKDAHLWAEAFVKQGQAALMNREREAAVMRALAAAPPTPSSDGA